MTNNPTIDGVSHPNVCASIQALLDMDARGSLAPHGIGGLARDVLTQAKTTIAQLQARIAELESWRGDIIHQVRTHGSDVWEDISGESLEMCQCQPEEYEIRKLYTAPPAPVAMVLPDAWQAQLFAEMERRFELPRSDDDRMANDDTQVGVEFAIGWIETCLDATAALNNSKAAEWHDVAGDDEGLFNPLN